MKEELDAALVRDFPYTFRNRFGNMKETCMCWGFDCGDGWEPIIRKYASKMEPIFKKLCEKDPKGMEYGYYTSTQVKEKFGTLRWYVSGNDEIYALEALAERESAKTCERCGKKGKLRGQYWVFTMCDKCWKAHKKERGL